jgi:hypothetical protein
MLRDISMTPEPQEFRAMNSSIPVMSPFPGRFAFLLALLMVVLAGCASAPHSPRAAFLEGLPAGRSNYVELYEVSVESLRQGEEKVLLITKSIVKGVKESLLECTNACPVAEQRLAYINQVAEACNKESMGKIREIEAAYDPKVDSILYFHYKSGSTDEAGYLITCGGSLKARYVFGEGFRRR